MIKAFNYFHRFALFDLKTIRPIENLSKENCEGSSHFWFSFYMSLEESQGTLLGTIFG